MPHSNACVGAGKSAVSDTCEVLPYTYRDLPRVLLSGTVQRPFRLIVESFQNGSICCTTV